MTNLDSILKSRDKESACNAGDLGSIPGREDPLEKEMATHSSILAPGRLQLPGTFPASHP